MMGSGGGVKRTLVAKSALKKHAAMQGARQWRWLEFLPGLILRPALRNSVSQPAGVKQLADGSVVQVDALDGSRACLLVAARVCG